ncbi:MAG: Hsp20/alpha crystallin family protein [Hyphomonadaceae bacterium]|nr:Hsp20/alpha crystallin family protein [Hyphomonadaceae bacterium]
MNRLFDDAFRGFGFGDLARGAAGVGWPQVEVTDLDKEFRVTAELPGLEENDVEIRVEDGVLSLRGEKHSEVDNKERRYGERFCGQFERRIALPSDVDEDRANATFKDGVLTITLPKTERAFQSRVSARSLGGRRRAAPQRRALVHCRPPFQNRVSFECRIWAKDPRL